ncbi:hypothetical protein CO695_13815 [Providencia alcalifaciens]|uniref:Uncharacterized protein n=1 Tax=Providencia alcalifaciens DSM 30120 TaxID=520999 RepID=B6XET9_9GAMM|nr:hypothetical protein [Providencia alcalifaciens]ATG17321.1 hypothetical protein CO695_13815 [Providencia alcalifaciens]EEB46027.1 hypothetical protein PROVALCAL_01870 [Providencia alcalifaciens DSM 30120]SQI37475.1 Uncharacterised protein [Providencia alcalifaciens]
MTVSTEISSNEYTGNGVTTDFDYKFRIFKASDLSVTTSDADGDNVVMLRLGTDYTVTEVNKSAGGKVLLTRPLADKHQISIARVIPIVQETSFRNQGKFLAETHEDAFDYLTMLMQRLWGSLSLFLKRPSILANWFDAKGYRIANLGKPKSDSDAVDLGTLKDALLAKERRALRVEDMDILAFPKRNDRKNKAIGFDSFGLPYLFDPNDPSSISDAVLKSSEMNHLIDGQLRIGTMTPVPGVGGERDTILLVRDIQGESDRHGFRDESVLSNITDHGTYGTFDAAVIYRGDNFYGHNFSFQDRFRYQGSGGVKLHGGLLSAPNYSGTGVIYERNGFKVQEYDGTSVVNTQIAIKIDALDKAKSNYTLVSDSPKASMLHTGVAIYGYPKKAPDFTEGLVYQGNWLVGGKQTGIRSEGSANKACFESYKAFSAKLQTTPEANVPDLIGYDVNTGGAASNSSVSRVVGFNFTEYNQIAISVRGIQLAVNAEDGKNNWQLFIAGTAPNWINSRTGFGVDNEARAPKARVDIQGSTETEAQLRLRAGTLTTTPLDGFIEFTGNNLYITIKGVRKKFSLID